MADVYIFEHVVLTITTEEITASAGFIVLVVCPSFMWPKIIK